MQYISAENSQLSAYYPKAVFEYLQKSKNLKPFYEFYPNIEGYGEKLKSRTVLPEKRKILHKVLKAQYDGLLKQPGSEAVGKNIDLLLEENTYTITTGQQIHIYLGPLYVTHKILSTIAKCNWLADNFKGYNFVPVFWMATEDHDFEEISHLNLYNREFKWPQTEGYTGAVGRLNPESINGLEQEVAALIQNDEEAKQLLALFTEAYKTYPTLADATRAVVHQFFGHTGLVVIDADDAALKSPLKPYIKNDIFKGKNVEIVNITTEKLEENYKAQIHPRDINFFYLTDTGRYRIVKEGDKYVALGGDIEFDEVSLTYEIDKHPEKFSPNVIMRPLYQELILPNLAYIGGPAEVNYWLQLKEMFKVNGVQFPILELRKSLIVLNPKTVAKIGEMGFKPLDFLAVEGELESSFLEENADDTPDFSMHYKAVLAELETIKEKALKVDANMRPFLEGEFKRFSDTFEKLDAKLEKAGKRVFEDQLKQIENIRNRFFKPGALAERSDTVLSAPALINEKEIAQLLKAFYHENKPLIIAIPPLI